MNTRRKIATQGPEFSRLIYGTWRILDDTDASNRSPKALLDRFKACVDLGVTTLDTAEIYGSYRVEEAIGSALKLEPAFRDRVEIVTKCGIYVPCDFHPERKTGHYNLTAARIVKSAEKSLRLMGIDHIDLLLVHRPDWLTSADETAAGLNQLVKDGKVRSIGTSNYNVHQFDLLNSRVDQPLATNQVEFSLLHMGPIYDGTFDQCQKERILPMAWSPLAKGVLMSKDDPAGARLHSVAAELADKYRGATLDQLAYAWIMAHPASPLPIIGTNKLERIQACVRASEIQLEREDWYALWVAARGHGVP